MYLKSLNFTTILPHFGFTFILSGDPLTSCKNLKFMIDHFCKTLGKHLRKDMQHSVPTFVQILEIWCLALKIFWKKGKTNTQGNI